VRAWPIKWHSAGNQDRLQHGIHVAQDVVVANTQHADALAFDPSLAFQVVGGLANMTVTVQFNCQLNIIAKEVEDVTTQRVLPAEFQPGQPSSPQLAPEKTFRNRRIATLGERVRAKTWV
jgi:hypothetical protein